jgi:hypothetical protein
MAVSWEEHAGEDPRTGEQDPEQRMKLYRLCDCPTCKGTGKSPKKAAKGARCSECRGEGKLRELIATCSEESLGATILRLGREGEWADCAFGLLDTMGEVNEKWLVRPWLPSARNVSDAGRTLRRARVGKVK